MPIKLYKGTNRSPNYRIRGTYLKVRVDQSSGTPDINTARKLLKKIKDEIECGALTRKPKGPTFAGAVELYVKEKKTERFIMPLLDYFGTKQISEITAQDIIRASHDIYPEATNATRNRQVYTPMLAILRLSGVYLAVKRPEKAQGNRRTFFFTQEAAANLINAAYDVEHELGLLLTFLLYTGARLSEALKLTTNNLNLSEASALFPTTKNGHPRSVFLPAVLVSALAGHPRGLDRDGRVFKYVKGGRLYKLLNEAERASGVIIPEGVSFHAFRHTFGSWMRRYGGLDTSGLVATGAWHSRDAAQIYEHVDATEAARKADLLPGLMVKYGQYR